MTSYKETVEQNSNEIKLLETQNINLENEANKQIALNNEIE